MKEKDRFDRKSGNNRVYKSVKIHIDPMTNEKAVESKTMKPIKRSSLIEGMEEGRKG